MRDFQAWYLDKPSLKSIWEDLDNYTLMLLSTRWQEDSDRETIRGFIREYLELHIQLTYKQTALEIFHNWLAEVNPYCYQGGYGYAFSYPNAPHHWVIKPEYYDLVSNIPESVQIAACVADKYIDIAIKPDREKWSG